MCGIAAILKGRNANCDSLVFTKMADQVSHRGPDDKGEVFLSRPGSSWCVIDAASSDWEIALGHRRLSILDLTSAGHQPMRYGEGIWTVYNGEVYNFIELREELKKHGHTFRSNSDTEVILASYAQWGLECFKRFRGMWGLVIIDTYKNEAVLSRDRFGIKPLYLWKSSEFLAVASEIKQFTHLPGFKARMNCAAARQYLETGYEIHDTSFFDDIHPVPAGTWIRVSLDTLKSSAPESYWHPELIRTEIYDGDEAAMLFTKKLRESVKLHLRSDVPVGCALSGGLDSSSIAVIINSLNQDCNEPLHTFTASYPGDPVDEKEFVDSVQREISANRHFVNPNPDRFLGDIEHFVLAHDEPVGDLSVYAGYCVARHTRENNVPVTLNGQGGDEILSAYWQSYFLYLFGLFRHFKILPIAGHFIGAVLRGGNSSLWEQIPVMFRRYRARKNCRSNISFRSSDSEVRQSIIDEILSKDERSKRIYEIRWMFLPRLLKWDDRNSMAFAVEGRYPFLDHELVELCLSFSNEILYSRGWTKWPLRSGLKDILPEKIRNRRSKRGFEVPQDKWLCGPLRPEFERWLNKDRPIWEFVERGDVVDLSELTWSLQGKEDEPGQALCRAFFFDKWLECFNVTGC